MADSLFDNQDNTDYLSELTKTGGKFDRSKYATEAEMYQAIAKGKVNADRTIDMQNSRFDELREDLLTERSENTAGKSFEQLERTLRERQQPQTLPKAEQIPAQMPEDLDDRILSTFAKLKQAEKEQANLSMAEQALRERFGENAKAAMRERMNTLELSDEDVKYLARKSPQAVLNALGLNEQQGTQFEAPPRSSLRSDNFKPKVEIRDAVYYEKLRRENPTEYFSEKISVQKLKDMDSPDFWTEQEKRQRTTF